MKKIKKISLILLAMSALLATTSCDMVESANSAVTNNNTNTNNQNTDESTGDNGGQSQGEDSGQGDSGQGQGGDSGQGDSGQAQGGDSGQGDSGQGQGGDSGQGGNTQQESFVVTFHTNGGTTVNSQTVTKGNLINSVETTKTGYTFAGWFTDSALTNSFDISSDKVESTLNLYAKWNVNSYLVTFNTNGGTSITSQNVNYGSKITNVSTTRDNYNFEGWYIDATLKTSFDITNDTITGPTTLYAKWSLIPQTGDVILNSAGYNEGAYVTFNVSSSTAASNSTVSYSSDSVTWKTIDKELIQYNSTNNTATAYLVGLKAGSYLIKVNNTNKEETTSTINVSEEDRSGYAHFNNSNGVGAYNNDGTLKDNAKVVYVTEETKNTVTATIGSKTYTGLANILQNANASYPLDVRILGTIGAPTWNQIEYKTSDYYLGDKAYNIKILNKSGTELKSTTNQSDLVNSFNTLDDSYAELDGLTSKIIYGTKTYNDTTYNDYDSYYNMLDISKRSNVTIEGIGTDATIAQWGFTWKNCNYIEVKNLTFNDYPEDACSFEGSDTSATTLSELKTGYIWVHNNTFNIGKNNWDVSFEQDKHEGDGATDFKGLKNVTISYNHYYRNHKTGLVGGDGTHKQANFTFHHNWYQENQARLPYGRQANMHMYNNFYDSSTGTNMQIHDGGYAFIENCYFKNTKKTFEVKTNKTSQSPAIKSYNNIYDNCQNYNINLVTITTDRTATVENGNLFGSSFDTDSSLFYYDSTNNKSNVSIMNSAEEVPTLVPEMAGAGKFYNLNLGEFNEIDTNVETYTVSFETNGGSSISSQTVISGKTIDSVSTTKKGYKFAGWYTDISLTSLFDVTTPITKTLTLYAKWEEQSASNSNVLNVNNLEAGSITTETTINNLTLKTGKTIKIETCNITVEGETITKCVKFGGGGSYTSGCINFDLVGEANITVYYAGGANRYPALFNSTGEVSRSDVATTGEGDSYVQSYTFENIAAGNYSIASVNSSMFFYAIVINYK